jgi:hypothetical protein
VRELQAGFSLETSESAEDAPLEDDASELVAASGDVEEVVFNNHGVVASGVKYQVSDFVTIWPSMAASHICSLSREFNLGPMLKNCCGNFSW